MITTTTPKLAITINLDDLAALVKEYLAHLPPRDRLETQLRFSHLLIWARKRQEQLEGGNNGTTSSQG